MHLTVSFLSVAAILNGGAAFTLTKGPNPTAFALYSTVEKNSLQSNDVEDVRNRFEQVFEKDKQEASSTKVVPLSAEEINRRLDIQLEKLRMKDSNSRRLTKDELVVIYEDNDIIVVDKPTNVLTVAGKVKENPSLAGCVFNARDIDLPSSDHMVVHRLGMDTSGLIVMAKNKAAVREMNRLFRERKVERTYEALVAGTVAMDEGLISLPLMRDYECPPYVRVSTYDHQYALIDLTVDEVGRKLLEGPKESITKYEVVSREELGGKPVTRVKLTSISGRYHQLNAHMAAFGHPIVGDTVYGPNGAARPNGGLTPEELQNLAYNPNRVDEKTQLEITKAAENMSTCVHAKDIKFRHPITGTMLSFESEAQF